jgi:hypothetical protein
MHRSWGEVKERVLAAMLFTGLHGCLFVALCGVEQISEWPLCAKIAAWHVSDT